MTDTPLTPAEVADLVRVSRRTVIRAIERGQLEASQLGERGLWRIWPDAVERWRLSRRPVLVAAEKPAEKPRRRGGLAVTDEMGRAA